MSTIERHGSLPQDNFTVVDNTLIRDRRLSPKARLLYIFMQSQPPGWNTSIKALADEVGISKDAIQSGVAELSDLGYLSVTTRRLGNGRLDSVYRMGDPRKTRTGPENQDGSTRPENQDESHTGNQDVSKTDTKNCVGDAPRPADGKSSSSRKSPNRGTRMTEDWLPEPRVREAMKAELVGLDFRMEHAKFVDHFLASSAATAVKRDWNAAWRNWMRKAWQDGQRGRGGGQPPASRPDDPYASLVDQAIATGNVTRVRELLEIWELPDEKPGDQRKPEYKTRWVEFVRSHRDEFVERIRERGVL